MKGIDFNLSLEYISLIDDIFFKKQKKISDLLLGWCVKTVFLNPGTIDSLQLIVSCGNIN
jgi:hypothetical protein